MSDETTTEVVEENITGEDAPDTVNTENTQLTEAELAELAELEAMEAEENSEETAEEVITSAEETVEETSETTSETTEVVITEPEPVPAVEEVIEEPVEETEEAPEANEESEEEIKHEADVRAIDLSLGNPKVAEMIALRNNEELIAKARAETILGGALPELDADRAKGWVGEFQADEPAEVIEEPNEDFSDLWLGYASRMHDYTGDDSVEAWQLMCRHVEGMMKFYNYTPSRAVLTQGQCDYLATAMPAEDTEEDTEEA